jgi:hypothetical protein
MVRKHLLTYITGSVNEELLLRNEYLVMENRILRRQITGRICLTDAERKMLAEIGKKLGKQALKEVATIVKPDTILGTTPFNRGEACDGLNKSGSFGHPARRVLPASARSRPKEASDEPARPILPQPAVPCQGAAGPGEHARA